MRRLRGVFPFLAATLSLGCSFPEAPPRESPELVPGPVVEGTASSPNPSHVAWQLQPPGGGLELWGPTGRLATGPDTRSGLAFDVAPDGALLACNDDGVWRFEAGVWTVESLEALRAYVCLAVASEGRGAAWVSLRGEVDSLCTDRTGGWQCIELGEEARALAVTDEHVWWMSGSASGASLMALPLGALGSEPTEVVTHLGQGRLVTQPGLDVVLLTPAVNAEGRRPHLITFDPATLSARDDLLAWAPEEPTWESRAANYVDVWLASDGRVLALDRLRAGNSRCSSGWLGYGGGCSTDWVWTQLIVVELRVDGVRELGHVEYEGGGESAFGVVSAGGNAVLGDRVYLFE